LDRLGVPLKVRQQRLGHSDSSLTLGTYTDIASEDDERFAEQLDGFLRPKKKTAQKWSLLTRCI
jgi:integrase